ncbi:MAG: hypothetical protein DDT36_00708 [Firmicutes bacterium]|nr:hypothetical protein [Bacillota bacterium]
MEMGFQSKSNNKSKVYPKQDAMRRAHYDAKWDSLIQAPEHAEARRRRSIHVDNMSTEQIEELARFTDSQKASARRALAEYISLYPEATIGDAQAFFGAKYVHTGFYGLRTDMLAAMGLTNVRKPRTLRAKQVGGEHYVTKAIQPWDAIAAWVSSSGFEAYLHGNIIKYVARYPDKGGVEDLKKAAHYIERLVEHLEKEQ